MSPLTDGVGWPELRSTVSGRRPLAGAPAFGSTPF